MLVNILLSVNILLFEFILWCVYYENLNENNVL